MNKTTLYKICVGIMMLSALSSCRLVEHYLYKEVSLPFYEGTLKIEVYARPKDVDSNSGRLTQYTAPYSLRFYFYAHQDTKLAKMRISNITLEGQDSGVIISLLTREEDFKDYKHLYDQPVLKSIHVMVGYQGENRNWSYEPYRLKARVRIYRDETTFDEKDIDVLLEPDFKKSRRSDTFDAIMSI